MTAVTYILAILLVASVMANAALVAYVRQTTSAYSQGIADIISRISTSPRIEVREAETPAPVSDKPRYISDLPYADESWNDFRGEMPEDDE